MVGLILGGIISIGLVFLRVFLRRGIDSPEQLEEHGINVYASIPLSEWLSKKGKAGKRTSSKTKKKGAEQSFLAIENSADLAIEAIRSLRTSLHFAMMDAKKQVL